MTDEQLDALMGEIHFEAVNSEIDRSLAGRICIAITHLRTTLAASSAREAAAVAAALEGAAAITERIAAGYAAGAHRYRVRWALYLAAGNIRALITPAQSDALAAHDKRVREAARKVKPLVWYSKSEWHYFTDAEPGSPGNSQKMQYVIKHYPLDGGLWDLYGPGHWGPGNKFSTLEAAKAAAQADYDARILSALIDAGVAA